MAAVWVVAKTELRRRWPTFAALIVVSGLAAGFALTAGVGARRADTAWGRLRDATLAPNVIYSTPADADPALAEQVARLPEVAAVGRFSFVPVAPAPLAPGVDAGAFVALSPAFGVDVYRSLIVSGRAADPRRPDEVTINEALAEKGIRVGQRVGLLYGFEDPVEIARATVVGVHRGEFDLGINSGNPVVLLNHAFLKKHHETIAPGLGTDPGALVRLKGGDADRATFERSVRRIYGSDAFFAPGDSSSESVRQAIGVQRVAWLLLALAAGLAVLVAAGQAVHRSVTVSASDAPVLRALGMRRPDVVAVGTSLAGVGAVLAAVVAVAVGILASPLVPGGLAQRADPDRGIRFEPFVLAVGAVAVVLVLVGSGALAAWRATRPEPSERTWLRARGRGPVPLVLGQKWALSSAPGPASSSARSALVAVAVGIAGVMAVVTFAASSDHLFDSPRLYGWSYDGAFDNAGDNQTEDGQDKPFAPLFPDLLADPDVASAAWGSVNVIIIEGQPVETLSLEQAKGRSVHPTLIDGRAPAGAGEIALASGTLRDIGKQVGDTVLVDGADGPQRLVIVGRAVYPEMGNDGDLAHFASVTSQGLAQLRAELMTKLVVLSVRDGADVGAVFDRHQPEEGADRIEPFQPAKLRNLKRVGPVPWVLAAFLAVLAVAAVGHALVTSVRARRRDIAVLRTLGLLGLQVRLAVAAQATTAVVVGALVGLPIGVALGRAAWSLIASGLGVVDAPVVLVAVVLCMVPAAVVVANLVAAAPAAAAARLRPAQILRTE